MLQCLLEQTRDDQLKTGIQCLGHGSGLTLLLERPRSDENILISSSLFLFGLFGFITMTRAFLIRLLDSLSKSRNPHILFLFLDVFSLSRLMLLDSFFVFGLWFR